MFDYTLLHWMTFFSAAFLLNISPGPDIAFILGQTVRGGVRHGFAAMFGVWTGVLGHICMAALGISAVLAASALAFSVVKWIGAGYLIWLGIKALRSSGGTFLASHPGNVITPARAFRQGMMVNLLNPKVAMFFLAFLPQFVVPGAGPTWAQLMLHGVLIMAVAALVEPTIVLVGSRLTASLRSNRTLTTWLDRSLGAMFVSMGAWLAASSR